MIMNPDGSRGVVFWIAPDGTSGWMVALYDLSAKKAWGNNVNVPALPDLGSRGYTIFQDVLSDTSGYENTRKLRAFQGSGNTYAAQCVDFEQGWYLPAIAQLRKLYTAMVDINPVLVAVGGTALKTTGSTLGDYVYTTSSEGDASNSWACSFSDGQVGTVDKSDLLMTRPVYTFVTREVDYDTTLNYRWSTGALTPFLQDRPEQTTSYTVTVSSSVGCTNSATRQVFVASTDPIVIYDTICSGEVYRKNGFEAYATGTYEQVLQNAEGCDLHLTLKLTVLDPIETTLYDTICEGEIYIKNNFSVWESGEYQQLWRSAAGCDSLVRLYLTVNAVYDTLFEDTVCYNEPYRLHGFDIPQAQVSGAYPALHYSSVSGCDSVVRLMLTVIPQSDTLFLDTVCYNEPYQQHGFNILHAQVSGDYPPLYYPSASGCDSVVRLRLTVHPAYDTLILDTVCYDEPYRKHGFDIPPVQISGDYPSLHYRSVHGCDSIVRLRLTVQPLYDTTIMDTVCYNEAYQQHGFDIPHVQSSGDYPPQFHTSVFGCDSVVRLRLTVYPVYDTLFQDTVCYNESYKRHGFSIEHARESGVYPPLHYSSVQGCDSIVRLELTVYPVYDTLILDTVCYNEPYKQHGFSIEHARESGDYPPLYYQSALGCDSVIRLMLTVQPVYDTLICDTVCRGEDYVKNGFSLTNLQESGDYPSRMLISQFGCDSLVRLHLTVNPVYDTLLFDTVCAGQAYQKYGFDYESVTPGHECEPLYLQSRRACDSTVHLQLTVLPVYFFQSAHTICENGQWEFRGRLLEEAGIYTDSLKTLSGCDSIYQLELSVKPVYRDTLEAIICEGERYQEHGFNESVTGFYEQHLQTKEGCDSAVYLKLQVDTYFDGSILPAIEDCTTNTYRFEVDWEETEVAKKECLFWWDFGDGDTAEGEKIIHQYADSGNYQVYLQVTTPGNCSRDTGILHHVAYYSSDLPIYARPEVVDTDHPRIQLWTDSIPGMSYIWELGDGNRAMGVNVFHIYSFDRTGTYEVKLTRMNAEDCPVESTLLVHAYQLISPPNTFSPNGDGINDFFMKGYRVRIINRNGVEIFKGEDGWDGMRNGQPVPEDTYFYELYYPTSLGEKQTRGYITVVW